MKKNSFGQGLAILFVVAGILYVIGSIEAAREPKCIEAGCDNKQASGSSYCYLHKPYTGSSSGTSTSSSSSSYSVKSSSGSTSQSNTSQSSTSSSGSSSSSLEKSLFSSPAACIKSIDARIRKLEKKYPDGNMPDIVTLKELKAALELISPADFSRYAKLLKLLNSTEYGWSPSKNNDRLVIFTERIETMRYLAENLKKDLELKDNQLEVMHGGMSDRELQRIVDEFGRAESPIRVIVASDVASEGINLHYLSHRLIHFDIPWSLMVFQQRNGRVDRYGQTEQPDIRYMLIDSDNPRIKGDARIMEILVKKEEQALKNIGDPAMLFGKFNQEEEEEETAKVIESGAGAAAFEKLLDSDEEEFDPLELLMGLGDEKEVKVEYSDEETLFSDIDYLKNALDIFTDIEEIKYSDLSRTQGVEIKLTDNVKKRIKKLIPPEAMPSDDYLRLSPDREYCLNDMKRCMQNDLAETAWPATQYLWKLHPIFNWIEDKAGVFYKRSEVPVLGLTNSIGAEDILFIVAGLIPNRKSTSNGLYNIHFCFQFLLESFLCYLTPVTTAIILIYGFSSISRVSLSQSIKFVKIASISRSFSDFLRSIPGIPKSKSVSCASLCLCSNCSNLSISSYMYGSVFSLYSAHLSAIIFLARSTTSSRRFCPSAICSSETFCVFGTFTFKCVFCNTSLIERMLSN